MSMLKTLSCLIALWALAPMAGASDLSQQKIDEIAKKANHDNTNLKETAVALGYVTDADFDRFVVPADMTHP